jgi:sugar/nucleoside kinase (ribokinase family)
VTGQRPTIAVVGALALDEIETPRGAIRGALGGSCAYVALAASLLAPIEIITVIGDDTPSDFLDPFKDRAIGLSSVRQLPGETFRWGCRYHDEFEGRDTLYTKTGVFRAHPIELAAAARQASHLFLTAGQTDQNRRALAQCGQRTLTMLDTIEREVMDERETLLAMLPEVDIVSVNEYESGILSGAADASASAQHAFVAQHGAPTLLLKQGPRGVHLLTEANQIQIPAVADIHVVDPTGAGDSFAGGVLGALASGASLEDAARWGCAVASFTVGAFGVTDLARVTVDDVRARATSIGLQDPPWLCARTGTNGAPA